METIDRCVGKVPKFYTHLSGDIVVAWFDGRGMVGVNINLFVDRIALHFWPSVRHWENWDPDDERFRGWGTCINEHLARVQTMIRQEDALGWGAVEGLKFCRKLFDLQFCGQPRNYYSKSNFWCWSINCMDSLTIRLCYRHNQHKTPKTHHIYTYFN